MPKIAYIDKSFQPATVEIIVRANRIVSEYAAQGFSLTLRQLYYQFVSRDWLANRQSEYSRLGSIISDARRAGLLDWQAIEDRTRHVRKPTTWDSPEQILRAAADGYAEDLWKHQSCRVEVWIEKDALVGVIEPVCSRYQIPFFSCRGYASDSELWRAAQRLARQEAVVLHLSDHDPSGVDMTRDIRERLSLFGANPEVRRIALTMEQIEEVGPPPNPAKLTDSRCAEYIAKHGAQSWELDALNPQYLDNLIERHVLEIIESDVWESRVERQEANRKRLLAAAERGLA